MNYINNYSHNHINVYSIMDECINSYQTLKLKNKCLKNIVLNNISKLDNYKGQQYNQQFNPIKKQKLKYHNNQYHQHIKNFQNIQSTHFSSLPKQKISKNHNHNLSNINTNQHDSLLQITSNYQTNNNTHQTSQILQHKNQSKVQLHSYHKQNCNPNKATPQILKNVSPTLGWEFPIHSNHYSIQNYLTNKNTHFNNQTQIPQCRQFQCHTSDKKRKYQKSHQIRSYQEQQQQLITTFN